jgi:hypothetical protein
MYRNRYRYDIKITKREVLASISIIAIMLLIGTLIFTKISEYQMDANEKYNKAVKIESTDLFRYGMATNVGNAFVYGNLEAIDTVTYPEIDGQYMYVRKVKEKYTMHTRTVTTTVNGKTRTRTETYWTWDEVDRETKQSKKVKFCGVEFNSSQFSLPSANYIDTLDGGFHIRYVYYGTPTKHKGTIFTQLSNGNIEKENVPFYKDMTIDETVENLQSDFLLVVFWIVWIILTSGVVFGFYYLDNRWLEG